MAPGCETLLLISYMAVVGLRNLKGPRTLSWRRASVAPLGWNCGLAKDALRALFVSAWLAIVANGGERKGKDRKSLLVFFLGGKEANYEGEQIMTGKDGALKVRCRMTALISHLGAAEGSQT